MVSCSTGAVKECGVPESDTAIIGIIPAGGHERATAGDGITPAGGCGGVGIIPTDGCGGCGSEKGEYGG